MADLQNRLASLSPEKRALLARRLREAATPAPAPTPEPVAVVGIGCRLPGGAHNAETLWQLLLDGIDAISEVPSDRWVADELYDANPLASGRANTRWGGFLDFTSELQGFDDQFFAVTPREAERMDPQQRLLLETAWEALEHAGLPPHRLAGQPVGVFVGIHSLSADYFWQQARTLDAIDAYTSTGVAHSIVANRLSYLLDLRGPSLAVDTACSSSLVAVHLACQSLRQRECDLALAGGVNLILTPEATVAFSKLQMMARDGRCKTFDARADGFVRGEGCGVIALKRLSDAQRDGDRVLALIRGTAVNQDGATNGLTAPNGLAQQAVIRDALANGGVAAGSVSYVETHGTGTALGDPIEVEAITAVLQTNSNQLPCVLGALKTNIGHLEAAAGIAGLIKAVLCLHHREIPRNLHLQAINPHVRLEGTRLTLPTEHQPWNVPEGTTRIAGVSSFGFGGTNAHIVLEEAVAERRHSADPAPIGPHVLPLSARTDAALRSMVNAWKGFLSRTETRSAELGDIAYSAACRRTHHAFRRAVVGDTAEALSHALASIPAERSTASANNGGLVFVYSGQGPQWPGMGEQLYESEPIFRSAIDRCEAEFRRHADWSLLDELRAPAAASRLHRTDLAQPALFAIQVALTELFRAWGIAAEAVVGHSIGEVAAAWASGALSFEDASRLVVVRGRLMQSVEAQGRMLAVELSAGALASRLRDQAGRVTIAAINSPSSVVVSGDHEAVSGLEQQLTADGVRCKTVNADYAFHSSHVEAAAARLAAELSSLTATAPQLTWTSSVTGAPVAAASTASYWARNMREPVRFADAISSLLSSGLRTFIEIGPHPVLTSMVAACAEAHVKDADQAAVVPTLRRGSGERHAVLMAVARLYELGFDINWPAVHRPGLVVDLPGYTWDRRPHWVALPSVPRAETRQALLMPEPGIFYEVQWKVKGRLASATPRPSPHYIGDSSVIVRRLAESRRRFPETPASTGVELDRISRLFAVRALCSIGGGSANRIDRARLHDQIVLPRATRLLARLVRTLESIGWLVTDSTGWTVAAPAEDPVERLERLIRADQSSAPILRLLAHCGPRLADALTGAVDPVSLLFSDDRAATAERIYTESLFARAGNALVAQAIAAALENLPHDRVVRALEIGAGTGATTAEIIGLFPEDRAEYLFTDVSSAFMAKARQHFDGRRILRYAALDIEKGLRDQGFADGQLDLIVAANVLHATTDLRATLDAVRRLLVPGGLLVLLEGAASRDWVDLTFGLTDGWWKFAGTDGRDYPLLSGSRWCETLRDAGFTNCESVSVSNAPEHSLFPQSVLFAKASAAGAATAPSAIPSRRAEATESITWCLFADEAGVAEGMRRQIAERGETVVLVKRGHEFRATGDRVQIRPDRPEDFDSLLAGPLSDGGRSLRCVYLWPIDVTGHAADTNWESVESNVCGPVVNLIGALTRSRRAANAGIWLITRGTEAPGAADIALRQSPLWGLGRVLALEHPEQWGGLIDLDADAAPDLDAASIVEEIEQPDGEDQIAFRGRERFVPRLVRTAMTAGTRRLSLRRDRAYFITGGTGGLGLQLARWMAENGAGWIVLGSRRATPMRDDVSTAVREIERSGAVVEVVAVDVAEMSSLQAVMNGFGRERPKLGGIVHAAGVIETQPIEALPHDALRRVMRPKVSGAWNLHLLSTAHAPDFFVMFSSAASVWGSVGLAHYSAANYFLDTLARFRERSGLPATCVNWGWWEGGGTTEEQHAYYAQIGLERMSSARALEAFASVLTSGRSQTIVAALDENRFNAVYQARRARPLLEHLDRPDERRRDADDAPADGRRLVDQLRSAPDDQGVALLTSHIRDMVAGVLGLSRHRAIDDAEGFFELGMDSIMTVELRTRLQETFGCSLPVTIAFEYPNVRALTKFIAGEIGLHAAAPAVVSAPEQPAEMTMLEELSNRSEDELAALLDESIAGALGGDVTEERR